MKLKDVIKRLQEKDQNLDVDYLVVTKEGAIVSMQMEMNAHSTAELLKLFPSGE